MWTNWNTLKWSWRDSERYCTLSDKESTLFTKYINTFRMLPGDMLLLVIDNTVRMLPGDMVLLGIDNTVRMLIHMYGTHTSDLI